MLAALLPLQRLTNRGVSVLVQHHPRKRDTAAGLAARGSGALSGFTDVLVEMEVASRAADGRPQRCGGGPARDHATASGFLLPGRAGGGYSCAPSGAPLAQSAPHKSPEHLARTFRLAHSPRRIRAMPSMMDFEALAQGLEQEELPPGISNRVGLADTLIAQICAAPWSTPEERNAAQALVYRLATLRWLARRRSA